MKSRKKAVLTAFIAVFIVVSAVMFLKLYPTTLFPSDDRMYGPWTVRAVDDYSANKEEDGVLLGMLKTYNERHVRGKNSYIMISAIFKMMLNSLNINMRMSDHLFMLNYVFYILAVLMIALFLYKFSGDANLIGFYLLLNIFSPLNFTHLTMYGYATIELFFLAIIIGLLCLTINRFRDKKFLIGSIIFTIAALCSAFSLFIVANMVIFIGAIIIAFSLVLVFGVFLKNIFYSFMPNANRMKKAGMVFSVILTFISLIAVFILLNDQARSYIATNIGLNGAKQPLWTEAAASVIGNITHNHFIRTGVEPCDYNGTYFLRYLTNIEPFFFLMLVTGILYLAWKRDATKALINNVYVSIFIIVGAISIFSVAFFAGYPLLRSLYPAVGGLTIFAAFVLSRGVTFRGRDKKERLLAGFFLALLMGHVIYSGFFMWRQYVARYSLMHYVESQEKGNVFMLINDRWSTLIPYHYSIKTVNLSKLMQSPNDGLLVVGPKRYYGMVELSAINAVQRMEDIIPALSRARPVAKLPFYSHDPAYLMQEELTICENYYRNPSWLFKQNPTFSDDDYMIYVYRVGDIEGIDGR